MIIYGDSYHVCVYGYICKAEYAYSIMLVLTVIG